MKIENVHENEYITFTNGTEYDGYDMFGAPTGKCQDRSYVGYPFRVISISPPFISVRSLRGHVFPIDFNLDGDRLTKVSEEYANSFVPKKSSTKKQAITNDPDHIYIFREGEEGWS